MIHRPGFHATALSWSVQRKLIAPERSDCGHHCDEWWVVLEGRIAWYIEGRDDPVIAEAGQIVYGPANRWHHIEILGDGPSTRLAINTLGEFHRYDRPGCGPVGSDEQWRPANLPGA
jgi:mannose-6-phosphate isomerase-like protein (cupin superfamily)